MDLDLKEQASSSHAKGVSMNEVEGILGGSTESRPEGTNLFTSYISTNTKREKEKYE